MAKSSSRKFSISDLFDDDQPVAETNDFAALLEASVNPNVHLSAGDALRGEILSIGKTSAFVSTGTPVDGVIPVMELWDENRQLKYKVGDRIDVKVLRVREGEIFLRRKGATSRSQEIDSLEDAFELQIPVQGRVTDAVNGGVRVNISGKSAFCPISQIDIRRVENAEEFIGKYFEFIITQYERSGRNCVVSRRKVLEQLRAEAEGNFIDSKAPGDILRGRISRLEKYGAFVELEGGIEALIPISELAWGRTNHPSDVVAVDQDVDVFLLRVTEDRGRLRISVSLKAAAGESDPWARIEHEFPVGTVLEGQIERKERYGLFIQISPGIVGLLPKSSWGDLVEGQKQYESGKKGDRVQIKISEILVAQKKLTLSPPDDPTDAAWRTHQSSVAGKIPVAGFGQLGDLFKNISKK